MAFTLTRLVDSRPTAALLIVVLALVALAWHNRFVQDDAFISFRYARNLVEGHGLVWNRGERVQGYTNFLWTVAIGGMMRLGADAVSASYLLGVGCFAVTMVFTYKLALAVFDSTPVALLCVALLGTNYSFSSYATGGLETQLQTCLFVVAACIVFCCARANRWPILTLLLLSVVLSAATLTRLDSLLLVAVLGPAVVGFLLRKNGASSRALAGAAALVLPFALIVGCWLAWVWRYYGDVLPNTYYAKLGVPMPLWKGPFYLHVFLLSYLLTPFVFLGAAALPKMVSREHRLLLLLVAPVLLWSLYLVKSGGCFMEFRFLVPVMPFLFVLFVWTAFRFVEQRSVRVALVLLVVAGSAHHPSGFGLYAQPYQITSIPELRRQVDEWSQIGKALQAVFPDGADVSIAVTAAGAVPFYSRLEAVDMLGLNDPWVARHGLIPEGKKPGHSRIAPVSYLVRRRVNLLIGNPRLVRWSEAPPSGHALEEFKRRQGKWLRLETDDEIPAHAKLVQIPVEGGWGILVLYLTPSPIVDEVAARDGWRVHAVSRR